MKLSEAIRYGASLRSESHQGPFTRIANTGELASDVYGAACEAVHSPIAKRNWNDATRGSDIEALREIQETHFAPYFKMPASCPGAKPRRYTQAGGRLTGRTIQGMNEFVIEREQHKTLGGLTTACPSVTNLAELIEHMFYVHNWSREECAQAVEWYEQQSAPLLVQNFEHYQDNAILRQTSQRLTAAAIMRQRQRQQRKSHFLMQ